MENFLLESWVAESRPRLVGQRIENFKVDIHSRVLMDFGRRNGSLLLGLRPARVYFLFRPGPTSSLLGDSLSLPSTSVLADEIGGASVTSVEKTIGDRIVQLVLQSSRCSYTLVLELIPSAPNLILLDPQLRVVEMLSSDRDRKRALRVGSVYLPRSAALRCTLSEACTGVSEPASSLEKWLVHHVSEMSPLLAAELAFRCQGDFTLLAASETMFRQESPAPRIYSDAKLGQHDWRGFDAWRDLVVSPVRLLSQEARLVTKFDSVNAALAQFVEVAEECEQFLALRRSRLAAVRAQAARQERAVRAAEADYRRMEDAARYRVCGELLLSNLDGLRSRWAGYRSGPKEQEVFVKNYYAPDAPLMGIRINPRKSPQANAEDYFKAYRKAQRGTQMQAKRLREYQRAQQQTRAFQALLEAAADPESLNRLLELDAPRPKATRATPLRRRAKREAGRRLYTSSDGYEIWVGRSAAHNEELTFRLAKAHDVWLHVADYTGSHVIVRNPSRKEVPRNTLIEAARLAAYFSAARSEPKVEVRYTEQKYVQKVRGAAAGLVRLRRFKTLYVSPQRTIGKMPPEAEVPTR